MLLYLLLWEILVCINFLHMLISYFIIEIQESQPGSSYTIGPGVASCTRSKQQRQFIILWGIDFNIIRIYVHMILSSYELNQVHKFIWYYMLIYIYFFTGRWQACRNRETVNQFESTVPVSSKAAYFYQTADASHEGKSKQHFCWEESKSNFLLVLFLFFLSS